MSVTLLFPSAISRYLVSNPANESVPSRPSRAFPSAISRYLVSNGACRRRSGSPLLRVSIRYIAVLGFQLHPTERFLLCPTGVSIRYIAVLGFQQKLQNRVHRGGDVSIRYIAVLGFQPYLKNAPSDQRRRKRFTHPPSNRSHSHICFLKSR